MKWTKDQQKVIDLRNRNILVSAAAGSGKTAVLVERIVQRLTDQEEPVGVDQLLVVTFTEAAAAEMKERIRKAIEKKVEENPQDEHLEKQANFIHQARIMTIHSFCMSVIREYFHVTDLEPGFRTGEEGELKLLKKEALEELLEEKYQQKDERFLQVIDSYAGRQGDESIEKLILRIYDYARSYPDWETWLKGQSKAYDVHTVKELEEGSCGTTIKEEVRLCLTEVLEQIRQCREICVMEGGPAKYLDNLDKDEELLRSLWREESLGGWQKQFAEMKFSPLSRKKEPEALPEYQELVKEIRDQYKKELQELQKQYFFQPMEEMVADLGRCKEAVEELAELVLEFGAVYQAKKKERHLIDFSDMEQYALRILTESREGRFVPTAIAGEYRKQIREIMIDEYQDSNLIQETILTSISGMETGTYNIFMVGDVKQSIYRFRLSRPELFLEKFDTYSREEGPTQRVDLHKNFRSRKEVLSSVNFLFRQCMVKSLGGIDYTDEVALYPGAEYPESGQCDTEILCIESQEDGEKIVGKEAVRLEAKAIALRIRELIRSQKVKDKESGALRPAAYSDIVILARSMSKMAETLVEVLGQEGIPAHAVNKEGYFETIEVGGLLDYLRVLDNRRQEIPLASVLTSPVTGLREWELARIKSFRPQLSFYDAVMTYKEEGEDASIREKLQECFTMLDEFATLLSHTPVHQLIRLILKKTGYGTYMAAMPGGKQRKANLDFLVEKARTFDTTSYKGVYHFVRYVEQLQKNEVELGEAGTEDEQSDVVRVMTIHKSKGLEFPIVIVAGMGRKINKQDTRSSVVLHATEGIGLDAADLSRRTRTKSLIKAVIQKEELQDGMGEELRVLYVALTRAKEKLILTGLLEGGRKKLASYEQTRWRKEAALPFYSLLGAVSYWDWILPACVRLTEEIPISVKCLTPSEILGEEEKDRERTWDKETMLSEGLGQTVCQEKLHRTLEEQEAYAYPYPPGIKKKWKYTVSELKRAADGQDPAEGDYLYEEPDPIPLLPRFLQGAQAPTGAFRGTAYHSFLEKLDVSLAEETELKRQLDHLLQTGRLSEEMAACIDLQEIETFLNSDVGKRMQEAQKKGTLHREQPFVMELEEGEETKEPLLIQGMIDAWWEEEDGIVVLDYKTDRVQHPRELADKYQIQLEYYAKALSAGQGKTVKEKWIYSFALKESLQLL
ncbi:helicase-exonuclease AddAB subunit AddA [Suipraeoptans intestinalis]|uniref:helicase-exonuclease AddAB subunit AddA n=1 Tax=Suipraeoptans intestinalis TaxID=2606628 RepID=UPI0023EFE429|nr:helicase-exonuclease AddAB subunit AddA [Suipraeoptans intestinalis]MDD7769813.1 helicase-exonuclease AddAB subunit AddA [Suipraeoptans intestinalis]